MSNSLAQLLLQMKDTPSTLGWGAILAMGQSQANSLLKQQYSDAFAAFQFFPPFSTELYLDHANTISARLDEIVLGPLEVFFESANSLQSSYLKVRLNIVGGTYTTFQHDVGSTVPSLIASQRMTAGMGFYVEARVSLNKVIGEIDKYGIARVDFSVDEETAFYSNLEINTAFQEALGAAFKAFIDSQENFRFGYELGHLVLAHGHPLSPVEFFIRTQSNPSRDKDGSSEGAVVFFIRLKGTKGSVGLPVDESDIPYFIPDDQSANKQELYTVALVLNHDLLDFTDELQMSLLTTMGLGHNHQFAEVPEARNEPYDLLLLGNVKRATNSLIVEPQFLQLKGGEKQQFVAYDAEGATVSDVDWSVSSVFNYSAVGEITPEGLYTALPTDKMDKNLLPTAVTATSRKSFRGYKPKSTAMLLSNFEGVSVAPFVRTTVVGGNSFDLVASSVSGDELSWTLLEAAPGQRGLGTLISSGNRATYTPPAPEVGVPLVRLQRIKVEDINGNVAHTSVVLLSGRSAFQVAPAYVEYISKVTRAAQFDVVDSQLLEQGSVSWGVLGEGQVTEGLYEPPETIDQGLTVNVVTCDLLLKDNVRLSSYAIVQPLLRHIDPPPPSWKSLNKFEIEVIENIPVCFANGLQQIPIRITIGTASVEETDENGDIINKYYPISDVEMASLKIYPTGGTDNLVELESWQEGIAYGSRDMWAFKKERNRFLLRTANAHEPASSLATDGERIRVLYLHCNVQGTQRFSAAFTSEFNGHFTSEDRAGAPHVEVRGEAPPIPDVTNYYGGLTKFHGKRVKNGEGCEGYTEEDPFTYVLDSIDYWVIDYKRLGMHPVRFATVEFEGNSSLLRWESDQRDEVFASYTGYVFYPDPYYDVDNAPTSVVYDVALKGFAKRRNVKLDDLVMNGDAFISPGTLVLTLNRVANIPFLVDTPDSYSLDNQVRADLSGDLKFVLIDMEGNRHPLRARFEAPTTPDSRNILLLSLN
ncbi:hypothetical protein SB766_01620 [Pseudomonas sp. SIMBA_077]